MTASELAKMLGGWPEGARLVGFDYDGGCDSYLYRPFGCSLAPDCEGVPVMDSLIDLACMSGLRWLMERATVGEDGDRQLMWGILKDGKHGVADRWSPMYESGPTLLHAIDAAIRAINPA